MIWAQNLYEKHYIQKPLKKTKKSTFRGFRFLNQKNKSLKTIFSPW